MLHVGRAVAARTQAVFPRESRPRLPVRVRAGNSASRYRRIPPTSSPPSPRRNTCVSVTALRPAYFAMIYRAACEPRREPSSAEPRRKAPPRPALKITGKSRVNFEQLKCAIDGKFQISNFFTQYREIVAKTTRECWDTLRPCAYPWRK